MALSPRALRGRAERLASAGLALMVTSVLKLQLTRLKPEIECLFYEEAAKNPRRHSAPPLRRCHCTQDQPARIVDEDVHPTRRKPKTNADCSRAKESSRADRHLIEQRSHAALNRQLHHSIIQIRRVCRCKPGSIEGDQPAAGMPNLPASEQVWAAHAQDGRSVPGEERSPSPSAAEN